MSALIELSGIDRIFYLGDSEVHALRKLEPVSYTHLDVYKRQVPRPVGGKIGNEFTFKDHLADGLLAVPALVALVGRGDLSRPFLGARHLIGDRRPAQLRIVGRFGIGGNKLCLLYTSRCV